MQTQWTRQETIHKLHTGTGDFLAWVTQNTLFAEANKICHPPKYAEQSRNIQIRLTQRI
jgi:hypothetical protein